MNMHCVVRSPGQVYLFCSGVDDPPRWVGVSGFHGTESRTSNGLELVCIEAVQSRGSGLVSTYLVCYW